MRWYCATCGAEHDELPLDWGYETPAYWEGPRSDEDELTSDLCIWTDDAGDRCYFIRGLLTLPVRDGGQDFVYGVWSSLSENSFKRVLELWDDPRRVDEPAYFGWLSNSITEFPETLNLPLDVITAEIDLRPQFVLKDADHALVRAQREGVTLDWARDVAAKNLHA